MIEINDWNQWDKDMIKFRKQPKEITQKARRQSNRARMVMMVTKEAIPGEGEMSWVLMDELELDLSYKSLRQRAKEHSMQKEQHV